MGDFLQPNPVQHSQDSQQDLMTWSSWVRCLALAGSGCRVSSCEVDLFSWLMQIVCLAKLNEELKHQRAAITYGGDGEGGCLWHMHMPVRESGVHSYELPCSLRPISSMRAVMTGGGPALVLLFRKRSGSVRLLDLGYHFYAEPYATARRTSVHI